MCSIPERAVIEKARAKGVTIVNLVGILVEKAGYPKELVTRNKIAHHFSNHVSR